MLDLFPLYSLDVDLFIYESNGTLIKNDSLWNKQSIVYISALSLSSTRWIIDQRRNDDLFNNSYLRNNNKNEFSINPRDTCQVLDVCREMTTDK